MVETASLNNYPVPPGCEDLPPSEVVECVTNEFALPDPLPLLRHSGDPFPFPTEELGPILGSAARRITEVAGVAPAIAGSSFLGTLAITVQAHANVTIDGRVYPISQFYLTLAGTGERKSESDRQALSMHHEFEERGDDEFKKKLRQFENERDVYDKTRASILNNAKSSAEDKTESLNALGEPPIRPFEKISLVEDPTYEGLCRHLEENSPSCGLSTDEGAKILGGWSMNDQNRMRMAGGLSNLWDGKKIGTARGGAGSKFLHNRRLSAHILIQPNLARDFINDELMQAQGIFGRFLLTQPSPRPEKDYVPVDLTKDKDMTAYRNRVNSLLLEPIKFKENPVKMGLSLREIPLSQQAKVLWTKYHNDCERWRQPDGRFGSINWLAAKSAEHVARIAASLSLFDDIRVEEISAEHLTRAVKIMEHYLMETQRIFGVSHDNPQLKDAQKLLAWLQKQPLNGRSILVQIGNVYQNGPSCARTKQEAMQLLRILEDHNWVRNLEGTKKGLWEVRLAK